MIGYIRGILTEADDTAVIVENQGIGYRIYVSAEAFGGSLPIGEEIKMYTYLHVKEDGMSLYGFLTRDELSMFKLLIGVNGIGPKAGMGVLSALSPDELRMAVLSEDVKTISKAPGIGKKTAMKLILELKDKMNIEDVLGHTTQENIQQQPVGENQDNIKDAIEALTALGYPGSEALKAVRKIPDAADMDVEEILKSALKYMI